MTPASTTLLAAAAASLLLGHALAIGMSHPDPDIMRVRNLNTPDGAVQWTQAQDTAALAAHTGHHVGDETSKDDEGETKGPPPATEHDQIPTHPAQDDDGYPSTGSMPLGGRPEVQPELKRSEGRGGVGGEGTGAVLLRRETSAAPTVFGVSIWLILAWLALLYLMYKTGSMF